MNIRHNIQLKPYNSFRTAAAAKQFCEPQSAEELAEILRAYPHEEKLILGGGYNLFFTRDFHGLVIKPSIKGLRIVAETAHTVEVEIEAGAGEDWDAFVAHCVSLGYAGVENLSLIPGTVGAAPIQNIGAYGTEVKDVITRVHTVEIETGNAVEFSNAACQFGYRDSIFKRTRRHVITSVVFRLQKSFSYTEKYVDLNRELENTPSPTLAQVRDAIIRIRTRKLPDPETLPNAGSFFKNPILTTREKENLLKVLPDAPVYSVGDSAFKTSAAFLIDKAGYKGKRRGNVGVYDHHALIIVNHGTENGQEILDFVQEIIREVRHQFGIGLEPEVWVF